MNRRNKPTQITDAPEHRSIPIERIELRNSDDDDIVHFSGYASTFESYEMYGGPANGGWIEQIARGAFDKTLREKPDLMMLINHEGMPLARTKSGTCRLSVDDHGLRVDAELDRRDSDVRNLEIKMQRGDMDEMSFAFRVKAQEWRSTADFPDDDMALRTITEVSLHKGDVSIVNYGANPTTSASVRSVEEALKVLAECDEKELAEIRSEGVDTLKIAQERLAAARPERAESATPVQDLPTGTILDNVRKIDTSKVGVALRFEGSEKPFHWSLLDLDENRSCEIVFEERYIAQEAERFAAAEAFYRAFDPEGMRRHDVARAEVARRLRAGESPTLYPTDEEIDALIEAEQPKRGMSLRLALAEAED